jgi:hypothetical protein
MRVAGKAAVGRIVVSENGGAAAPDNGRNALIHTIDRWGKIGVGTSRVEISLIV